MKFEQLRIDGLRCLTSVSVSPGPRLNFFLGCNGAGKTSLLEAAYLLSYGRSFRSGTPQALLQRGLNRMHVYGEVRDSADRLFQLGLGRESDHWRIRINGSTGERISDLVRYCAVVCFEPGSHALIGGPAEERRRFLDWGVFHVEHRFLGAWQRYRRALKQRNQLLRAPEAWDATLLEPWERAMVDAAQSIDALRRQYLSLLEPELLDVCDRLLPELGKLTVHYRPGWDNSETLARVLAAHRERDQARGYTMYGIHRADWRIAFTDAPRREHLSRGQEKLCALACLLAQARVFAKGHGEWPVVCFDDLASELDVEHRAAVLDLLRGAQAQVLITGTELEPRLRTGETRVFHVEHGTVTPAANL